MADSGDVSVQIEEDTGGDTGGDAGDSEKKRIVEVKPRYGSVSEPEATNSSSTDSHEDKVNFPKGWKWILFILYTLLVLATLLSLARWGCLMTLTVTYVGDTLNPGNNSLLDSQLLALGNLLAQSARAAQFVALIYGLFQFTDILGSTKGHNKLKDISKMFCECCRNDRSLCTAIVHTIILVGVLLLYALVTCPPPVLLMIWFKEFAGWQKKNTEKNASIGYAALAWFHHISDLIIRIIMGVVTRLIMVAWTSEQEKLWSLLNSEKPMRGKFKSMVQSYKETGKVIAALQGIFQVWFVMTWIVYFIGITGNTVLVLKPLLLNQVKPSSHRFWFYFVHLINDIIVFIIPYICGGLMNYYHDNYRETLQDVQERLISECKNLSECLMQSANLIPENPKYRFVPALCCLSIPLESAGYTVTILLTLFAFLLTLITDFTDV